MNCDDRKYSTTWGKKPFLVKIPVHEFYINYVFDLLWCSSNRNDGGGKILLLLSLFSEEDVNGRQTTIFLVWKQSPKFVPLRNRTGSPCISKPGPPVLAIPSSSGTIQRGREREGSHVGWGQEGEAVAAPHAGWDTAPCSGGNGPPRPTRMLWLVRCRITRPTRLGGASPRSPVQFVRRCR